MALNTKDFKILQQLDLNPRIPTTVLAKRVRLSQQVVDYRIKRMIETNLITSFGTIFNPAKIGYEQYRILFQLDNVTDKEKHQIIHYLKNDPKVYWAAIVGGKWDLFVVIFVKNYDDYERFLDGLFTKYHRWLKDYYALLATYHELYGHKFLHSTEMFNPITMNLRSSQKALELDALDISILSQTKSNCRASSLEISRHSKTTYKTVQNRIKNLENEGLIVGYRLFLKSEQFEYKAYLLLLSFQNYGRDLEKKLLGYARSHPLITQALKLFGQWSLQFHVRVRDQKELQNLVIELRNTYPLVGEYEIIPIFEDISINTFPMSDGKKIH